MRNKVSVFVLFIVCIILLMGQKNVDAYSGGLLNGMPGVIGKTGKLTYVLTDNDPATTLEVYSTTTGPVTYTLSKPADITNLRINLVRRNNEKPAIYFYGESDFLIGKVGGETNNSLSSGVKDYPIDFKAVRKVAVHTDGGGWGGVFGEFDIFGNYDLPMPLNVRVVADARKAIINFDIVEGAKGYGLYVNGQKVKDIAGSPYELNELNPDESYTVQLSSVFDNGVESKLTNSLRVVPYNDLILPVIQADVKWNQIDLSWNRPNGSERSTLFSGDRKLLVESQSKEYTFKGVQPNTDYSFYVEMKDKYGRLIRSEVLNVKTPDKPIDDVPPEIPINFRGRESPDRKSVTLTWDYGKEQDISGYNVYVKVDGGYKKISDKLVLGASFVYRENVTIGETYTFKLNAVDQAGNVSEGAETSVTITPVPVTDSDQKETSEYLLVTWKETEGAIGYRIYFNGRVVGAVGPDVFEFKVTKDMGYRPGALENRSEVRAIFADGTEGGGNNPPGSILKDLPFNVPEAIKVGFGFLGLFDTWVLLMLAVIFAAIIVSYLFHIVKRKPYKPVRRG